MVIRTVEKVDYTWKWVRMFQIGHLYVWLGLIGASFDWRMCWSPDQTPFSMGFDAEQELLNSTLAGLSVDDVQKLVDVTIEKLIVAGQQSPGWSPIKASLWDLRSGLMRSIQRKLDLRLATAHTS